MHTRQMGSRPHSSCTPFLIPNGLCLKDIEKKRHIKGDPCLILKLLQLICTPFPSQCALLKV